MHAWSGGRTCQRCGLSWRHDFYRVDGRARSVVSWWSSSDDPVAWHATTAKYLPRDHGGVSARDLPGLPATLAQIPPGLNPPCPADADDVSRAVAEAARRGLIALVGIGATGGVGTFSIRITDPDGAVLVSRATPLAALRWLARYPG